MEQGTKIDALMGAVIAESNLLSNVSWRMFVDLYEVPVRINPNCDDYPKSVRTTCGLYGIKYLPKGNGRRNPKCPYVFINDMLPMRICVSGPRHLEHLAREIPEIRWILRNSNYSPGLFHWALWHPGLKIPFCFDAVKYCDMLEKKAKDMGIPNTDTTDFKPLVTYEMGKKRSEEFFGKKRPWIAKGTNYATAFKNADKLYGNDFKDGE